MISEQERIEALAAWLAERPECVQRLAAEFPAATQLGVRHRTLYVMGWTEDDSLIVSGIDPATDWDAALAAKEYVCASHFR